MKRIAIVVVGLALIGVALGLKYNIPGQETSPLWPILISTITVTSIYFFAKTKSASNAKNQPRSMHRTGSSK